MKDSKLQALADKASKAHGIRCDKNGQFHNPPEIEAFDKVSIDAVLRLLKRIADLREYVEHHHITANNCPACRALAADEKAQGK